MAAVAVLRRLATKFQIPGAAAHRSLKGDLQHALMLKNNIESAEHMDLISSADLLAKHRQQTEQTISQISERWEKISERMRKSTVRFGCAAVVLCALDRLTDVLVNEYEAEPLEGQVEVRGE
ncbi:uncharacterized protein [Triticum aestivum]|uniref:uncharacterized protein n=1 Tax=Triticum aestivum TaxID=4565 RepID=UPI000844E496|nr:uncharacterized protein LOC123135065 [Triticum aestivum]